MQTADSVRPNVFTKNSTAIRGELFYSTLKTHKICNKKIQPIKRSNQGGDFMKTFTTNVEFVLLELDATKSLTWNFHGDDRQKHLRYDMITGRNLLLEIQLYIFKSNNTIKVNVGSHDRCTVSVKDPSNLCDDASFGK